MKNILILSDSFPKHGWGGGVIIRSLTEGYPKNLKLFWTTFNINSDTQTCNEIEVLQFKTTYFRGRGMSSLILWLESQIFIYNFKKLVEKNKIDLIWVVLGTSYDKLYRIKHLVKNLSLPIHISVHDDPILEISKNKRQPATILFQEILSRATSIDVISSRMQQQYKMQYKVNSIVITRCIPQDFPQNNSVNPNFKTILMGGYGNASPPWPNPMIKAIEKLNRTQNFKLHLFDPKLKPFENEHVKVHDLISEEAFNELLKTVDLGYACDDLNSENLKFSQLSLPTKVITYIGAAIPFVYHGPKNSTVGDLINQYEIGIIVDSNNKSDLVDAFLKLQSNYQYYQDNCRLASKILFSHKIIQKRFFDNLLKNL